MTTATERVNDWLSVFEKALNSKNVEAATAQFGDECFWRDLVFFTWNIKTCEGRNEISHMLKTQLPNVGVTHWRVEGDATGDEAMTEAWILIESDTARGKGVFTTEHSLRLYR